MQMQTILVLIDFTPAAENALVYANKLALRLPAEIVLVCAGPGIAHSPECRTALLGRLVALAERLRYQQLTRQSGRRIRYHYHVVEPPLPETLELLVAGYVADLVVAGLALADCAAAAAAEVPLVLLPEHVSCPVLLVPPGHHELAGRVVVSGDFAHFDAHRLAGLPLLARATGAHFNVVQFFEPGATGLVALKKGLMEAHAQLPNATAQFRPQEDPLEDLSDYCAQEAAQLLVLATTDGCLLRRFFNPAYRQTHAYHLRIPVLLLPTSTVPTAAYCAQCSLRRQVAPTLQAALLP